MTTPKTLLPKSCYFQFRTDSFNFDLIVFKAFAPTYERITEWLRNLGLERNTQHFLKEEIDMDVAPLLTEKHLIKLGVDSLSARLLLCSAIDKLKKTSKSFFFCRRNEIN